MKTNQEVLSSILKTTQMGQIGIRSVLGAAMGPNLRQALHSQLKEYDSIETEAHSIAKDKGWQVPELNSSTRVMTDMMTRMMLMGRRNDSRIADMMILGNTRGMTKTLRNSHQHQNPDERISALSRKLLDRETENIRQMKPYL